MIATVLSVLIVNLLAMTEAYNLCNSTLAFSTKVFVFLSFRYSMLSSQKCIHLKIAEMFVINIDVEEYRSENRALR